MIKLKNNQTLRLPMTLGISFVTTVVLIGAIMVFYHQGITPFGPTAHAATVSTTTCASTKGTQPALCEHQDPMVQDCAADAETVKLQAAGVGTINPIGYMELRYSPTCQSYWVRATILPIAKSIVSTIHVILVFHDQSKEDIVGTPTFSNPQENYLAWTDMTTAPLSPNAASGSFDFLDQSQPLTVALAPSLPPTLALSSQSSSTCASTKGSQSASCEHQDPMVQGCTTDAETVKLQTIVQQNQPTKPLGEVELRYSPTCQSYWVRTTAFITAKGVVSTIHAILVFHDQSKEDIVGTPTFPDPQVPYVAWTDMTMTPLPPNVASGSFDILGQSQPVTVAFTV